MEIAEDVTEADRAHARRLQHLLCTTAAVYHEGLIAQALAAERHRELGDCRHGWQHRTGAYSTADSDTVQVEHWTCYHCGLRSVHDPQP